MSQADPRKLYERLVQGGLTHAQACGVLGNIQQESGFLTSVEGYDGTGSYGLCQWLGVRKKSLKAFAESRSKRMSDALTQIDFIFYELSTTEKKAAVRLLTAVTPSQAALQFSRWFERPAKTAAHNDKRVRYAEQWARELSSEREGAARERSA